jgi:hypothetical protein
MGLLSKIWKGVKGVVGGIVDGVKKVFRAILEPVAKLFDSGFGKALMIGLAVFTLGSSLLAGVQGFLNPALQGQSFLTKFVNGGKEFLNTLLGTKFETAPKELAGGGGKVANVPGVESVPAPEKQLPADILTGEGAQGGLAPGAEGAGNLTQVTPTTPALGVEGMPATTVPGGTDAKGWLSKAAGAAWDFAKSEPGSNIIGSMIQGVGAGMAEKNRQEFDSRIERMFANPNDPGMQQLANTDYSVNAGGIVPRATRGGAQTMGRLRQARNFAPTVPYAPQPGG